jgi:hypothetical protein
MTDEEKLANVLKEIGADSSYHNKGDLEFFYADKYFSFYFDDAGKYTGYEMGETS